MPDSASPTAPTRRRSTRLTGFHGAHVIGGLVFIFAQWLRGLLGHFDAKRNTAIEAATLYWHFVGFVWLLVIFPLVFFLS